MVPYTGKTTIEAIEYIELRQEVLQELCNTLKETANTGNAFKTDREIVKSLTVLFSVLDDEIKLLNDDITRAWETANATRKQEQEPAAGET